MALWVWRFVEGEPPHFILCPSIYSLNLYYIYVGVWGDKKGSVEKYWGTEAKT